MNREAERLDFPARAEGDDGELQGDERGARDHHAVDAEPRQKARHRHCVEQPADREAGDDDAGDRKAGFAEFEQERRDKGNNPSTQQPSMKTAAKQTAFGLLKMVR